jgi:hypothetical protein
VGEKKKAVLAWIYGGGTNNQRLELGAQFIEWR